MSAMGHEERFPSPSLSGRCRLGEATFAGMGGKEEDAPKAVVRPGTIEPLESTLNGRSLGSTRTTAHAPSRHCRWGNKDRSTTSGNYGAVLRRSDDRAISRGNQFIDQPRRWLAAL